MTVATFVVMVVTIIVIAVIALAIAVIVMTMVIMMTPPHVSLLTKPRLPERPATG
jgi:hypothetical protein